MTATDNSPAQTATATDTEITIAWSEVAHDIGTELHAEAAARDRSGEISADAFEILRASGITSALVPGIFGGGGATHADMGEVLRELGRYDPATAVALSMHSHVLAAQVWRHHHGMDAEKVFRKVVDDHAVLISTGASDWVGSNGTARRVEGGFRVNARKGPASGCEVGDVLVTSIRWDEAPDGPQVLHFSIPMRADGVSIDLTWDTLGMRATGSHTVVLDEVFVPDAAIALTRPADAWHPFWNTVLGAALPLITSAYLGVADAAVAAARDSVAGRTEPHVTQLLGEMLNAHTTAADVIAMMFVDGNNLHFDNTDEFASHSLSRKVVATDAMIQTVRLALEVTGGFGYTRNSVVERLYRDVHGCLFHPVLRAKQTQFSGRVAQGLSPIV
jgi:acyl-CoA dehydrogenase